MKNLKALFTLFAIVFSQLTVAQKIATPFKMKTGPLHDMTSKREKLIDIILEEEDFIYMTTNAWKGNVMVLKYDVQKYDKDLNLISTAEVDLNIESGHLEIAGFHSAGSKIYVIYSVATKTFINWYKKEISKENCKLTGKETLIAKVTTTKKIDKLSSREIVISKDKSKIALVCKPPVKPKQSEQLNVVVLDNQLNVSWQKNFTLPFNFVDLGTNIPSYKLDDEGTLYMLNRKRMLDMYKLYEFKNNSDPVKYSWSSKGKGWKSFSWNIEDSEKINLVGVYVKPATNNPLGVCAIQFKKGTKDPVFQKDFAFSKEFITQSFSESRKAKVSKKIDEGKTYVSDNLSSRGLMYCDNGDMVYMGEYTFIHPKAQLYDDIVVARISNTGELKYLKKIVKEQRAPVAYVNNPNANFTEFYLGARGFFDNGIMYFLFNDSPDNLTIKKGEPKNAIIKTSVTVIAQMNEDGTYSKQIIDKTRLETFYAQPAFSQVWGRKIYFFEKSIKKDQKRMNVLDFD